MSTKLSADEFAALPMSRRIKAIAAGSIGNLVEWYDWLAYSTFSLYFAHVFFPGKAPTAQLLNTAGIFAVGYVMRPVGAILFGWFADRRGRRAALSASVFLMCGGSLIVALAPGYDSIGVAAPVILIVARMLQGLSVGGEYGASAAYLMEVSPARSRGFFVSFHYATLLLGQLLAVLTLVVLQFFLLTPEQLDAWGWRIPFVIGSLLSVVAFYLRRGVDESPSFQQAGPARENPLKLMLRHPRAIVQVLGMTVGGSVAVNTFSVYMPKFLVNTTGLSKADSTLVSALSLAAFIVMQPLVGALSDRVGRKPCLIVFGILGSLCAAPLLIGIAGAPGPMEAFGLVLIGLAIASGYSAVNAVAKAELFPVHARAIGVGLPYSIIVAVVGGTSEWLGLLFKHSGFETGYYFYVAAAIFVSLMFYLWLPETRPARGSAEANPAGGAA